VRDFALVKLRGGLETLKTRVSQKTGGATRSELPSIPSRGRCFAFGTVMPLILAFIARAAAYRCASLIDVGHLVQNMVGVPMVGHSEGLPQAFLV